MGGRKDLQSCLGRTDVREKECPRNLLFNAKAHLVDDINQGLSGFSTEALSKTGLVLADDDCFDPSDHFLRKARMAAREVLHVHTGVRNWCFMNWAPNCWSHGEKRQWRELTHLAGEHFNKDFCLP